MRYIDIARKVRAELEGKKKNTSYNLQITETLDPIPKITKSPYETNEIYEKKSLQIEEAAKLYRERGWIQIYSGYLKANLYLTRDESVKVPHPFIPRYTEEEIRNLRNLSLNELKPLHEAKKIFCRKN